MKKIFFSLVATLLILACEKKDCCTIIEAYVDISVIKQSSNKDLLNPGTENHYDIKNVALEFSTFPNQKTDIDAIQYSKPLFFQKGNKYYLRIFPTTNEPLDEKHTVSIYWSDTDIDKVTFYMSKSGGNTFTEKILVNDELKWDKSKANREITILK